jgi:protein-export membrane protein SecD
MTENFLAKLFNPTKRGRLRWLILGIFMVFILALSINLIGSSNQVTAQIDQTLSGTPLISDLKIFPTFTVSPLDNSRRLSWRSIKEIDLQNYGLSYRLGLDLLGGAQLTYDADLSQIPLNERKDALEGARDVIERRVDKNINYLGVSEPIIRTVMAGDQPRISIELAGVYDVNSAIKMIGETPLLEFKEQNPNAVTLTAEQQKQLDDLNLEVRAKAVEVLQKVKAGEDFATLARQYSEDLISKDDGGLYERVTKNQFIEQEFNDQIFNKLQVGELAQDLVKTDFGYHIIKKEGETGVGDERQIDVRHILFLTKTPADIGLADEAEWINTKLSGKNLKKARVETDQFGITPQVSLEFDNEGGQLFAEITGRNVGKPVAIFLDGEPITIPTVNEPILDGQAVISGTFTPEEAKQLAQRLNNGALPIPVKLISQTTVGATLGKASVEKSIIAGLWGLLIVALFMVLYYRLSGVLSVVALIIYAAVVMALFKIFNVTLTMAGITGFILSIGMAVDANILIFERMKEELKFGRDLPKAVEEGFKRAWTSIRDSNISSLITCGILFWFGSSIVRGFAFTLAIGVVVSMFSAIIVSKQLLLLTIGWKHTQNPKLYGINKK